MRKIVEKVLALVAKRIIKKYRPIIIGITGSVGKTGTKEAIYTVLNKFLRVRKSEKNYNTEVGLPLTVIGVVPPGHSLVGWLKVFFLACGQILLRRDDYPQVLILEMAADKPGDIKYLTQIAPCQIGVVTAVGPTHLQAFEKIENVLKEKKIIVTHLSKNGVAILNKDDQLVWPLEKEIRGQILTFGFADDAQVVASDFKREWLPQGGAGDFKGVSFEVGYKNKKVRVYLPNILGKQQVYNVLAAMSVGLSLDLGLEQIVEALAEIKPINGRMRLLDGIKNSLIIDDSYNSSPAAAQMAVDVLGELACEGEKFAILGDMLELGSLSEQAHKELGLRVVGNNIDYLVTVGELGKRIAHAARRAGMKEEFVYSFADSVGAGKFVQDRIESGDLLLIKGSQGARMEKIVKEIMAEPERAEELLVRQDKTWMDI